MDANVQLSAEEMRLMTDPAWILTKNSILRKVVNMFADLSAEWRQLPVPEMLAAGREPKISKGEQYKGLPWVMLDYPRLFGKEEVLAIRTMFWWGHCFSVTLHLKGDYQRIYMPVITARRKELIGAGFSVGISDDEWEHEHQEEEETAGGEGGTSWRAAKAGEDTEDLAWGSAAMARRPFLKLSARCELDRWREAPGILTEKFAILLGILIAQTVK